MTNNTTGQTTVWLHEELLEQIEHLPHAKKRLAVALTQLAAHGYTTVTKACIGANAGWRRSPMGGNGGMQYYLWWCPAGSGPMADLAADQPNTIWARAIRQHNDHRTLNPDHPNQNYLPAQPPDLSTEKAGIVIPPWNHGQQAFATSTASVKTVRGIPGSGKTSALWHAIESQPVPHTIYITWSANLTRIAQERLDTFLGPQRASCSDYQTLVGQLAGHSETPPSIQYAETLLRQAVQLSQISPRAAAPWSQRPDQFQAECHGYLLGPAIPDQAGTSPFNLTEATPTLYRLDDNQYLTEKAADQQANTPAARSLLTTVKAVLNNKDAAHIFHHAHLSLALAAAAIINIRQGRIPPHLKHAHRIALDEAQDLTLVQLHVIVELAKALTQANGFPPQLLIAADEAQTLLPSAFDWPTLEQHLTRHLSRPSHTYSTCPYVLRPQ